LEYPLIFNEEKFTTNFNDARGKTGKTNDLGFDG
jgi:hypothetical protein